MDSGMVSKIQKARFYARERDRVQFQSFRVVIRGDHHDHQVSYDRGNWSCECGFFRQRGLCSHTMALERILGPMLQPHSVTEEVLETTA
jgi:hypothetical protein